MRVSNGIVAVAGIGLLWMVFVEPWMYANPKNVSVRTACLSNLKQQATAFVIYQSDFDDRYPKGRAWMDELKPYLRDDSIFHHPGPDRQTTYRYAFNVSLFGTRTAPRPESVPLVYDSTSLARNASDRVSSLPSPARHDGKDNMAYADGHAKAVEVP